MVSMLGERGGLEDVWENFSRKICSSHCRISSTLLRLIGVVEAGVVERDNGVGFDVEGGLEAATLVVGVGLGLLSLLSWSPTGLELSPAADCVTLDENNNDDGDDDECGG